jgi:hypothetical protein
MKCNHRATEAQKEFRELFSVSLCLFGCLFVFSQ